MRFHVLTVLPATEIQGTWPPLRIERRANEHLLLLCDFQGQWSALQTFLQFWEGYNAFLLSAAELMRFWPKPPCLQALDFGDEKETIWGANEHRASLHWCGISVAYLDISCGSWLSSPGRIHRSDAQRPQVPVHPDDAWHTVHTGHTQDIHGDTRDTSPQHEEFHGKHNTYMTIVTIPPRNSRTQKNSGV